MGISSLIVAAVALGFLGLGGLVYLLARVRSLKRESSGDEHTSEDRRFIYPLY